MLTPRFRTLGHGRVVLMLHGIGGGNLAFAPQVESFAQAGWRAVSWDAPGYGASAPIEPYTFKGLAASAAQLIESLKDGPVVVLGHSMGGMVAQELVARRPDLVRALVLSGTSPAFGKADGAWQAKFLAERTAPLAAGGSMTDLALQLVPTLVGPAALPEGVALAKRVMSEVPAATYRAALGALMGFDRRASLAQIAVPTLCIAGEADQTATPALIQRMAHAINHPLAGTEYLELAGVGHLANLEAPDTFDGAVLSFLSRRAMEPAPTLH
jgi:pimeloyl-ACP methyl ester carboxylesterase